MISDLRRECWWGTLTQNLKLSRTQALGRTFYFPPSQLCIIRFYIWNTLKIILPLSLMLPPPSLHSLGAPRIPGFCISLGLLTLPRPLLSGALSQPELGTAPSPHPQRGPPVPTSQPHGHWEPHVSVWGQISCPGGMLCQCPDEPQSWHLPAQPWAPNCSCCCSWD